MASVSDAEIFSRIFIGQVSRPPGKAGRAYPILIAALLEWNSKRNAVGKVDTAIILNY